ncbi:MAG: hypothetical protein NZ959_08925 [Armatimonadetes bacterium]|nr:hypothetical protein [Armatimonadota bacterium]MDW8121798.1 hypothetical protein [Armatimonadota bacterium]
MAAHQWRVGSCRNLPQEPRRNGSISIRLFKGSCLDPGERRWGQHRLWELGADGTGQGRNFWA